MIANPRSATGSPRRTGRRAGACLPRSGCSGSARAARRRRAGAAAAVATRKRSRSEPAAPERGGLGSRRAIIPRPMPRDFARLSSRAAVERLRPGMKVLVPPGCGEPVALLAEICAQAERLRDLTLLGGIQLGDVAYARPEHAALRAAAWHMSSRLADARRRGRVEVVPAIGRHVAALVPDRAAVQVGVGGIPQAVLESLDGHRDLALHSLLVDAAVGLVERGVVTCAAKRLHRGRMDVAEAMGTRRLFDFLRDNDRVNMESSEFVHDPEIVARLDRFVSINSALEIDLTGQVTAESLGGRQVAGIGGQFDFVLGASRSRGGAAIIALPSTGRDGSVSPTVPQLAAGAAATTPRLLAASAVTAPGAANL